jgi:hypothetical protein
MWKRDLGGTSGLAIGVVSWGLLRFKKTNKRNSVHCTLVRLVVPEPHPDVLDFVSNLDDS